jgi:hypothetical protein
MTDPRGICPGETSVGCHSPGTIREDGRPAGVPCRSVMKPLGRDAREASMSNARSRPVELVAESDLRFAEEDKALFPVRLRAVTTVAYWAQWRGFAPAERRGPEFHPSDRPGTPYFAQC